jgi:hypothetical protein
VAGRDSGPENPSPRSRSRRTPSAIQRRTIRREALSPFERASSTVLGPVGRRDEGDRGLAVARELHRPERNRGVHRVERAIGSRIAGCINDAVLAGTKAHSRAPAVAGGVDGPHFEGHRSPEGAWVTVIAGGSSTGPSVRSTVRRMDNDRSSELAL